jgi:hypothetical protein
VIGRRSAGPQPSVLSSSSWPSRAAAAGATRIAGSEPAPVASRAENSEGLFIVMNDTVNRVPATDPNAFTRVAQRNYAEVWRVAADELAAEARRVEALPCVEELALDLVTWMRTSGVMLEALAHGDQLEGVALMHDATGQREGVPERFSQCRAAVDRRS